MRKTILALTAAAVAVPTVPATPAFAHDGYYRGKVWQDSRGRYRCKRPNGTTGLIVGAAGGALIGRAIDTRGGASHGHHHRRGRRRTDRPQDRPQPGQVPMN